MTNLGVEKINEMTNDQVCEAAIKELSNEDVKNRGSPGKGVIKGNKFNQTVKKINAQVLIFLRT